MAERKVGRVMNFVNHPLLTAGLLIGGRGMTANKRKYSGTIYPIPAGHRA